MSPGVPEKNKEAVRLIEEGFSEPDKMGPEAWAEFHRIIADPNGVIAEIAALRAHLAEARADADRLREALEMIVLKARESESWENSPDLGARMARAGGEAVSDFDKLIYEVS